MYLFIATHLGSGASMICDCFSHYSYIIRMQPRFCYSKISDIDKITHASILYDKLVFNYELESKSFYSFCKFIYVVRDAPQTLGYLVAEKNYSKQGAYNYYCFRLRRLCEMIRNTPNSLLLTWDDLVSGKAYTDIQKYLGLKRPPESTYEAEEKYPTFPLSILAQKKFDKYFANMKLHI